MTIHIGIIGTGMIGEEHARRITLQLTGATITAVTDVDQEQARGVVERLGLAAEVYPDGASLIASEAVDAVMVTSWGPTHEEYVLAAIEAGKPVFCEKPLATTADGCRRIIEAEQAAGKRLVQVGFMRRYDSGYQLMKEAIDTDRLGAPLMVHAAHRNPEVPERYVTPMAIHDTLIHELDTFRWLLDDDYKNAQVVFPRKTRHAHSQVADPQIVMLETVKGVRIDVEVFVNCRYGYDIQCEVVGEEGVARLPEPQSLQFRQSAQRSNEILMDWKKRFADAFSVELQAFIDGAASGTLGGPSSWDGYAAAIAGDVCVRAQESGAIEPILMPERPAFYA
ncbi:Gfo/Idh/MocA family protein [Halomonas dongshanensis]|uniref:Inositol 2-dehydrogenase n=1 Tax=Halomonas dongshanensis TaxID=2890835 RepID=A0ABT2E9X1_9GAMM|nr:Gfo/Idh/MocA family oxidoreductase [Halomonas dongshanensis]MCS2608148.1 Gfo/Idh/MocA family oxidoreductase [Halomonas dongshanensis]